MADRYKIYDKNAAEITLIAFRLCRGTNTLKLKNMKKTVLKIQKSPVIFAFVAIAFFITLTICFATTVYTQNLVPNPSFEEISSCPDALSQIENAIGWEHFVPTPDLFHFCHLNDTSTIPCPRTGNAQARILSSAGGAGTQNEIFGIQLTDSLEIEQKYYVSFYAILRISEGFFEHAKNKLGARFTTERYCYSLNWLSQCDSTPLPIDNLAHVYTDEVIFEQNNWVRISGSFIADSNYKFIAIGHHFDNDNMITLSVSDSTIVPDGSSKYFIDDVCVSTDSLDCIDIKETVLNFTADDNNIVMGSTVNFSVNTLVYGYDSYQWFFTGGIPEITTENSPSVQYPDAGSYNVKLIAYNGYGCADTIFKNNYITVTDTVTEITQHYNLLKETKIYPNPAGKFFNIKVPNSIVNKEIKVELYTILGKLILEERINRANNKINIEHVKAGAYFVKIYNKNENIVRKLLINK